MMRVKNPALLFAALCVFGIIGSCAEKEEIDPDLTFTLLVENTLTRSVDVYLKHQADLDEPFVLVATANSAQIAEIQELVIREAYRIRFVNEGRPVDEFFEERGIANLDATQTELLLIISE